MGAVEVDLPRQPTSCRDASKRDFLHHPEASPMEKDAVITTMEFNFKVKRTAPLQSDREAGEQLVELPPSLASEILLLNEMVLPNVTPSELARGTGTILQEVNRILDIDHLTKIDRIAQALGALANRLDRAVR
jgi:antitoxin HicB